MNQTFTFSTIGLLAYTFYSGLIAIVCYRLLSHLEHRPGLRVFLFGRGGVVHTVLIIGFIHLLLHFFDPGNERGGEPKGKDGHGPSRQQGDQEAPAAGNPNKMP